MKLDIWAKNSIIAFTNIIHAQKTPTYMQAYSVLSPAHTDVATARPRPKAIHLSWLGSELSSVA